MVLHLKWDEPLSRPTVIDIECCHKELDWIIDFLNTYLTRNYNEWKIFRKQTSSLKRMLMKFINIYLPIPIIFRKHVLTHYIHVVSHSVISTHIQYLHLRITPQLFFQRLNIYALFGLYYATRGSFGVSVRQIFISSKRRLQSGTFVIQRA